MPRKNAMRENVAAVRSRLPYLSDLSREKIELALLYFEFNIDETVEAFKQNGAIEALSGWTEMSNGRENSSFKGANKKPRNRPNPSAPMPPSTALLRPSQRASNIFQTFADGGIPTVTTNGNSTISSTTACSSLSSSFIEQSDQNLCSPASLNQDTTANNSQSSLSITNSLTTVAETTVLNNAMTHNKDIAEETNEQQKPVQSQRRRSVKNRHGSTSSIKNRHSQSSMNSSHSTTTNTVTKSSSSNSTTLSNNRKMLTKSAKDLQRQTSTLTNVELLFNNEMKSSIKRIDDIFTQIRDIIKEREVELYLQMDQVKSQGLNLIQRRQQRATELRQQMDRCDRLEPSEIDVLRNDIKQFVTNRRYDFGEELTSSHRFEFDQNMITSLKTFGHVATVQRKSSIPSASALDESNVSSTIVVEKPKSQITLGSVPTNGRIGSSSNENDHQQALPQRSKNKKTLDQSQQQQSNGEIRHVTPTNNITGNYQQDSNAVPQANGHQSSHDNNNNYPNINRRRPQPYSPGNVQQPRSIQPYPNDNNRRNPPKPINGRANMYNNSETTNTYRRPRLRAPPSAQSSVSVQT